MKAAMVRRNVLTVVGAAAMGLAMVMPAFAATTDTAGTSATVNPGTLDISDVSVPAFGAVSITGAAQTTETTINNFTVSDLRGTGDGWGLSVQATQFTDGTDSTLKLNTGSLTLSGLDVAANGTTSGEPSIVATPGALDSGQDVRVATAATGAGMGKFDFSAGKLTLALPADVYEGTYNSTLTFTLSIAP